MKKSLITILALSILSLNSVNVSAFTFEDAAQDDTQTEQTTETTDTANDETAAEVNISNMDIVFDDESIPADWKTKTKFYVKVSDDQDNALSDKDVKLNVKVSDDNGTIWEINYNKDTEVFEVEYTAWKTEGTVSFTIEAISKADPEKKLEQLEDFTLSHYEEPKKEEDVKEEVSNTLKALDETETKEETKTNEDNNEEKVIEWINIIGSKIIDTNTIKISFDKKIFLPEDPLSLIEIKKSSDGEKVAIENVSLSNDEKGLIVLTSKPLAKEPYVITINEVIDGETKKKVSVANPELTVTGLSDYIFFILWLMLTSGIIFRRRKQKS